MLYFNESELYYKTEFSSEVAEVDRNSSNLEFLRLAGMMPTYETAEIIKNRRDTDANTNVHEENIKEAGQVEPSPETETTQPEIRDNQEGAAEEIDQGETA